MDDLTKNKLKKLILKRSEILNLIRQFDELYYRFSNFNLKEAVEEINYEIQDSGSLEILKILYDDPYSNRRSSYYVQVLLYSNLNRYDFYLDNTKANPAITFEGQEFNAKVKISFKMQNEDIFKQYKHLTIQELTKPEIQDIIVSFLEQVYQK